MIDTEVWNDEKILESFTSDDKFFWLYLLTNPHNTLLGVFKFNKVLASRDMGYDKDVVYNLAVRFANVYNLVYFDEETKEIMILNWYKYNWNKSEKLYQGLLPLLQKVESSKIRELLQERIAEIFDEKEYGIDRVCIGYGYPSNTNTISNNNSKVEIGTNTNTITNDIIENYFDTTYNIYPRKVNKQQAKTTYEHKFRGLDLEEGRKLANRIYKAVEKQISLWQAENKGNGRELEYIPHFSSWLNDNIEDSPKFKKRR